MELFCLISVLIPNESKKPIYIHITEICAGYEREVLNICSSVKSEVQRKNVCHLKLLRVDNIYFKQLD